MRLEKTHIENQSFEWKRKEIVHLQGENQVRLKFENKKCMNEQENEGEVATKSLKLICKM